MKKITTFLLSVMSTALIAQIPNPSFENWTSGTPNGWYVVTANTAGSVTQSTNAHAGSYAVQLNTVLQSGFYFPGELWSGAGQTGYFYNTSKPVAVNGWYITNLNGGDELWLGANAKCPNDSVAGSASLFITGNTSVYKQFSLCYVYIKSCAPDSAFISLTLYNSGGMYHAGTYAIIDDLSFGSCATGVPQISKDVDLEAAYPNPASTTCNIIYSIPSNSTVSITLYDINGKKIEDLLGTTFQSSGRYKLPVDVSNLQNGIYIYRVVVNGASYSQKLTVLK